MVADRDGDCAMILRSMHVDLDNLVADIERRLPQPTFPLQQARTAFANDPRVHKFNEQLHDAQQQVQLYVGKADLKTAACIRTRRLKSNVNSIHC